MNKVFVFLLLSLIFHGQGISQQAKPAAADPALEKRVTEFSAEIRCLVCQNQSLADSNAELAVDLRNQIRDQMKRGASDGEIAAYLVARYGDFVLYRPPVKATTVFLWFGPFVCLALGAILLMRRIRRQRAGAPELSEADRARAAELLKE